MRGSPMEPSPVKASYTREATGRKASDISTVIEPAERAHVAARIHVWRRETVLMWLREVVLRGTVQVTVESPAKPAIDTVSPIQVVVAIHYGSAVGEIGVMVEQDRVVVPVWRPVV